MACIFGLTTWTTENTSLLLEAFCGYQHHCYGWILMTRGKMISDTTQTLLFDQVWLWQKFELWWILLNLYHISCGNVIVSVFQNICTRWFSLSATKICPFELTAIPSSPLNSPSPWPHRPNPRWNTPSELNIWMRLFPESATYIDPCSSTATPLQNKRLLLKNMLYS